MSVLQGVTVIVDPTLSDKEKILAAVQLLGGNYVLDQDSTITHAIVVSDLSEFATCIKNAKLIRPEWIKDCLAMKRICPEAFYSFPNPKITTNMDFSQLASLAESPSLPIKELALGTPDRTCSLLAGLVFYIEPSILNKLEKKQELLKRLTDLGAVIADKLDSKVTHFITNSILQLPISNVISFISCQQILESNYKLCSFRWLQDMLSDEILYEPLEHCLHYPFLKIPISGMESLKICVSNYYGQARDDIKVFVHLVGAKLTTTFTKDTTHLVCARPEGKKYDKALEWNVHVVNHLWLEDCYMSRQYKKEGNPSYLYFSPVLNDMVGLSRVSDSFQKECQFVRDSLPLEDSDNEAPTQAVTFVDPRHVLKAIQNEPQRLTRKRVRSSEDEILDKKRKTKNQFFIQFTGVRPNEQDLKTLSSIGIHTVEDIWKCDLLVADRILRTEKMLVAICKGIPIVRSEWIIKCIEEKQPIQPSQFLLKDTESETKFSMKLKTSLQRAQKRKLFEGMSFYVADTVDVHPQIIQNIIVSAGGECLKQLPSHPTSPFSVICGVNDIEFIKKMRLKGFRTFSVEYILASALKQEIEETIYAL